MGETMNDDEIWASIDTQRLRTADLLEALTDSEWRQPSLCDGWTVRDVAAHLTLQQQGLLDVLRFAVRHPASVLGLNRAINRSARFRAVAPVEGLIADLRAMVGSRRHNIGLTSLEPLIDILVHGQDIALPLGRDLPMAPDAAAVAATRVWSTRGTSKAKVFDSLSLDGLRLQATDTDWAVGEGVQVEGPIAALLLLLTGRRVALAQLSGPGADLLREKEAAVSGRD
jgi:uncharacterized protein (TIGR03083 family)